MWIVLLSGTTLAATWVVDPSGAGDATTIEDGLALLAEGDTLEIRAGTYYEGDIWPRVLNVTIIGEGKEDTIIDARYASSSALGLNEGSYVEGLTFQNAPTYGLSGSDIIVSDCAFVENYMGVFVDDAAIFNSVVAQNYVGIQYQYVIKDLRVENTLLVDNDYIAIGTGFYSDTDCTTYEIHHNLFVGSGFVLADADVDPSCNSGAGSVLNATNNLFVNVSYEMFGGAEYWTANWSNNVYPPASTILCSDPEGTVTCTDNLAADPSFVAWSDDGDWTNDDYHLVGGSPGIDHGLTGYATSAADLDGVTRPLDGDLDGTAAPDAGPYEYNPDADADSHIDLAAGGDDCDDHDAGVYPGAAETWYDGTDQDCDGRDDDQDGDGYGLATDCDDLDAARSPAAAELCEDGLDQDCDGADAACPDSGDSGDDSTAPIDTDDWLDDHSGDSATSPTDDSAADTGAKTAPSCAGCATDASPPAALALALALALAARRRPDPSLDTDHVRT